MEKKADTTNNSKGSGLSISELKEGCGGGLLLLVLISMFIGLFFRSAIFDYLKIEPGWLQTTISIVMWILGSFGAILLLILAGAIIYAAISMNKSLAAKIVAGGVATLLLIVGLLLPVWGHWNLFEQAAGEILVFSVFLMMATALLLFWSIKPASGTGGIGTSTYNAADTGKAFSITAVIIVVMVSIYPILFLIRLYWLFLLTR